MVAIVRRIFLLGFLLSAGAGVLSFPLVAASATDNSLRVGFFAFPGYHDINPEGEKSGYGYEYLQRMATYTGWQFEYVGYEETWEDMERRLEAGEIDLVTGAVKTPARLTRFAFSDRPLGEAHSCLSVKAGNSRFHAGDYGNWDGMRVGMLRNKSWNETFTEFAAQKGFSYTPIYFDSIETLGAALRENEVDALWASSLRRTRDEWVYERFAPLPFYAIVKAGNHELLREVNAVQEQLALDDPLLAQELAGRYYTPDRDGISYTVEERRFMEQAQAEKRVFQALLNPDRAPFSELRDGEWSGVMVDIARHVAERTGLDIRLRESATREEYLREIASGDAEILFDARHDYSNAEKRRFHLTPSYFYATVSRLRLSTFTGEPQSIAVVKDSDIHAMLLRSANRSDAAIVTYPTLAEVVRAVKEGYQDVGYVHTLTAEAAIYRDAASGLTTELVPGMTLPYAAAIRFGADPRLISIMAKAVQSLSPAEVDAIWAGVNARRPPMFSLWGWMTVNPLKSLVVLGVLLLIALGGIIALLWTRRKVYRFARITAQLPLRYFVADRSGQILLRSGGGARLRGPELANIADIPVPYMRELVQRCFLAVLDSGEEQTVEYIEGDGSKRSARISKLPYAFFRRECAVWVSQDTTELQQAREEARDQAERFLLTLKSIGDAVLVTDRDGNITLLNPVAERLTGWSLAEARGLPHEEVYRIESCQGGEVLVSPVRKSLLFGRTIELGHQTDLIARDGTRYHIADCAAPIRDSAGEIIGVILSFRDMTVEYENRDRLARARTSLEYASELTRSAAFSFDIGANRLTGSNLLAQLWPEENGRPMSLREWVWPEDLPEVTRTYRAVRREGLREAVVEFRTDFFGARRYYRVKASLSTSEPQNPKVIGVLQDITEQTLLIENQRVLNHCLEALFESADMQQAIRIFLETIMTHMQAAHCYILRTEVERGVADTFAECSVPGDAPFLLDRTGLPFDPNSFEARQLLEHQAVLLDDLTVPEQLERISTIKALCREQHIRSIYIAGIYVNGELWGELGLAYEKCKAEIFNDLNLKFLRSAAHMIELLLLRERAAEHLKEALTQAQAANRAKSFFLASMSHEIRTPLNAVIGFAELLRDGTLPPPARQDYLNSISSAGNALLALINDVLDLSKLEADQMMFSPVETDFAALVAEVEAIFRPKSQERGLWLRHTMPALPHFYLDTLRLRQILFNLVGNAVKFTQQGGIDITVEFQPETAETGTLVFRVADTGIGISEADRESLFQPFVQSSALRGTHAANNGTGLGLVIVDRMLEKMNGSIALSSELGRGSVFTVTLRDLRYRTAAPVATPLSSGGDEAVAATSVLLVDDVPMNLKVMSAMLRRLGVRAETAGGAKEALEKLAGGEFDFLLTDLWMPEMNGAELARQVRDSGRFPGLRIVAVTADIENRENFDMTVFDAVLTKPVTADRVKQALQK